MSQHFKNSSWIWISDSAGADEYGEFIGSFVADESRATCRISCDGDYVLYINGKYIASNQYGDYEHYKIYDEIDITPHLRNGENKMQVLVWHYGIDSQRYKKADAGVIFELEQEGVVLLSSNEKILCKKSSKYLSGYCKEITSQLGLSFLYDASKEEIDEWVGATVVDKFCSLYPRPAKKLELLPQKDIKILCSEGNYYLIDLGEETVGLPTLDITSESSQKILVTWGEDLQGGHVRRRIGNRDFSFEYIAKEGRNQYTNYMLRLGCRYMELYAEAPIELNYLGLIPQIYPVTERSIKKENELDGRIYDLCVRTLKLCMMEHYVDTPWREQCLYAFDSRNQMLCGYTAFEDGNAEYARANLLLMGKDRRQSGLLSICSPCGMELEIPSFSLYYFIAVREYIDYTGDISLGEEVYQKLVSIAEVFLKNRSNGLITRFSDKTQWNFYDWSKYLEGKLFECDSAIPDLIINCLFVIALENMRVISQKTGKLFPFESVIGEIKARANEEFYDSSAGAYSLTRSGKEFTVLGNSLAILAGVAENASDICEKIVEGSILDCSLSMRCFKYDALIMTDKIRFKPYITEEIRRDYGRMLEQGATSVWETSEGASAFGNAGSLCHGWSAIPICYL